MTKTIISKRKPSKASICREAELKVTLGPKDLYELLKPRIENQVQEIAWSISLDCGARVLSIDEVGRGAVDHVEIGPRELFRPAIESAASYVVMAHYHPSGERTPSQQDIELTRRMMSAGEILQVPLVDHMVITQKKFTSLSTIMPEFTMPELLPPYKADDATKADAKEVADTVAKFDKEKCKCPMCTGKGLNKSMQAMLAVLGDRTDESY